MRFCVARRLAPGVRIVQAIAAMSSTNLYQNRIHERCELFLPMGQYAEFPVIVCHY